MPTPDPSAVRASLIAAALAASTFVAAAAAARTTRTLTVDPAASALNVNYLFGNVTVNAQGTVDFTATAAGPDTGPGTPALAGLPAADLAFADALDVTVTLPLQPDTHLTAPAGGLLLTVAVPDPADLANPLTALGPGTATFDQPGVTLAFAGDLTVTRGDDVTVIDLAALEPAVDQTLPAIVLDDTDPARPRLSVPVGLSVDVPISDNPLFGTIPLTVTGLVVAQLAIGPDAPTLPGDFNGSGSVEQADLDLVLGNWGSPTTPPGFLANTEGLTPGVDQDELDAVLGNWGQSTAPRFNTPLPGVPGVPGVPEPATLAALALAPLALQRRR